MSRAGSSRRGGTVFETGKVITRFRHQSAYSSRIGTLFQQYLIGWVFAPVRLLNVCDSCLLSVIFTIMATTNEIRNRVIDILMAINDQDYLKALEDMIKSSNVTQQSITLTEEQRLMLSMSDQDIEAGRIIDQDTLDSQERKWLTGE